MPVPSYILQLCVLYNCRGRFGIVAEADQLVALPKDTNIKKVVEGRRIRGQNKAGDKIPPGISTFGLKPYFVTDLCERSIRAMLHAQFVI